MELTLRPFVTAGVALTATSAIALAPPANAHPSRIGTGPDRHTHTSGAVSPTGKLAPTATAARSTLATRGHPILTPHLPTAAASLATSLPGPGLHFGFAGTGTTNFGENANIVGVNLYGVGTNNTVVNTHGLGMNLANPAADDRAGSDQPDQCAQPGADRAPADRQRRQRRPGNGAKWGTRRVAVGQRRRRRFRRAGTGQAGGNGGASGLLGYGGAGGAGGRAQRPWPAGPAGPAVSATRCWATAGPAGGDPAAGPAGPAAQAAGGLLRRRRGGAGGFGRPAGAPVGRRTGGRPG